MSKQTRSFTITKPKENIVLVDAEYFTHLDEIVKDLKEMDLTKVDTILVKGPTVWSLRVEYGRDHFNERFRIQAGFNPNHREFIITDHRDQLGLKGTIFHLEEEPTAA